MRLERQRLYHNRKREAKEVAKRSAMKDAQAKIDERRMNEEVKMKLLMEKDIDEKLLKRDDLLHILGATFTLLEKACRFLSLDDIAAGKYPLFQNVTDEPIREYIRSGMAQRAVAALGRHTSPFLPHLAKQREEMLN